MQLKMNKSTFRILLIIVALMVWFHNGYKFFIGVQKADEVITTKEKSGDDSVLQDSTAVETRWVYEASFRDPFKNWLAKSMPKKPSVKRKKVGKKIKRSAPKPPKVRLNGIIKDGKGTLCIIENQGETKFVRTGDKVFGVKIVSIDSNVVAYEFNGDEFVLNLK